MLAEWYSKLKYISHLPTYQDFTIFLIPAFLIEFNKQTKVEKFGRHSTNLKRRRKLDRIRGGKVRKKKMGSDAKVFSLEEVSKHNTNKDCWLIIGGKVYDVSKFLDDHPGGDDVLISATGKDATDDFEDVGHSDSARGMMEEYYVGQIDASTIPAKKVYTPPNQPHYNQDKTTDFIIKILQFLVPLAILGLAVVVRIYTRAE